MLEEMVVVKIFANKTDAEAAQQLLHAAGAEALIVNGEVTGSPPDPMKGHHLLINCSDMSQARKILYGVDFGGAIRKGE